MINIKECHHKIFTGTKFFLGALERTMKFNDTKFFKFTVLE